MKNKLVLIISVAIITGIISAVLYSRSIREEIDAAADVRGQSGAIESPGGPTEGIGGMSVSGMEIVQGEKGHELWRLLASTAVMSEEGGDIVAEKPNLTYYIYSENGGRDELYVSSDTGDVEQQNNRIRFLGNVRVTHEQDILSTSLLVYDGPNKRLDCPEKSWIESPGMNGTASAMSWHLDDNTLHASGGVDLNFESERGARPIGQIRQDAGAGPKLK